MVTRGERAADAISAFIGSWKFIILQTSVLAVWFAVNSLGVAFEWDPYPFILANLFMSAEAAFATPLLLMSQNRAAAMDREILHKDFAEDSETKRLVVEIHRHLEVSNSGDSNDG